MKDSVSYREISVDRSAPMVYHWVIPNRKVPPMLVRSKDRKVTNAVSPNGKTAVLANSFGLPSGTAYSCPGATSFCERICYAGKLEKIYKGVKSIIVSNYETLLYADYLNGIQGMTDELMAMVAEFDAECINRRSKGKTATNDFRIHWDGDFFSVDYAEAWANVMRAFPHIQFWVYTRTFMEDLNVIPVLSGIENLSLYLSADPVNIARANEVAAEFPGTFIATVADTFAEAKETIIDASRKSYRCPENRKAIPLISTKGSACISCGVCVAGRGDVLFSVKKR